MHGRTCIGGWQRRSGIRTGSLGRSSRDPARPGATCRRSATCPALEDLFGFVARTSPRRRAG
jgi:hypothetical protein